jgi:hypothetical protein
LEADATISRRQFLKILGFVSAGVAVGLSGLPVLFPKNKPSSLASAQTSGGTWVPSPNTSIVAMHVALLPSGKIFYLAGSGNHDAFQGGPYEARILDINTGSEKKLVQQDDLFCIGLSSLPNGNILVAGGTLLYDNGLNSCNGKFHGLNAAYEVDVSSESLVKVANMAHGRWYPTCVTLPNGQVFVVNGFDEYGVRNRLVEIYTPSTKSWTIKYDPSTSLTYCVGAGEQTACPGAGSPCYGGTNKGVSPDVNLYPRSHVMPSGLVVVCDTTDTLVRTWDPSTGQWRNAATTSTKRDYGTTFLLPLNNNATERGKVLLVGGSFGANDFATTTVEILDFNAGSSTNPVVRNVAPIQKRRKYLLPIILPNGKAIIFGGAEQVNNFPVYIPEMFDPITETWTSLTPATIARVYHGTALLLLDGSVWTASSTPDRATWELRCEIYRPDYYSATRPTISGAPTVGGYGGTIIIPTPAPTNIKSVSLVKLGCTTHHYDTDMRLIWLQITGTTSNSVTVSAPLNANIAPPGYYMIHVLDSSGVPSIAKIVKIPGGGTDTTPPSQVAGLTATSVGSTQINLSWTANPTPDGVDHYNVYRGTTAGFVVTPGTTSAIATPTTNTYSNTGLSGSTTYYYRVAAVDAAGNIGALSSEVPATTSPATGTNIFYNVAIPGNSFLALNTGGNVRLGEEAGTASSILVGKSLKSWKVRLRKTGSPSGNITAKVRRISDDLVVATFTEVISAATLSASFAEYTFTLTTPYIIANGDKIMIEYNGPAAVDMELWNVDKFDGSNTRRVRYTTSYSSNITQDVAGSMST